MDRRNFLRLGGLASGAALLERRLLGTPDGPAEDHAHHAHGGTAPRPGGLAAIAPDTSATHASVVAPGGQRAVVTPNGSTLPLRSVRGVKVGHLIAGSFTHEFAPGLSAEAWGYNGGTPGPTIEAVEGDRLRLYVTNRLPEPTTVHWHGIIVPNGMDGVAGLTQRAIPPGETFVYEFTVDRPGTYLYHPHYDEMTQIALGMVGFFIVHPRKPRGPRVDRDFALLTHEWSLPVGARRPDPMAMSDFNLLTFNSRAFPGTQPLLVQRGERVRIRLGNLGPMDHHPIHFHGLSFHVTATDGGYIQPSAQVPETTTLVPVGTTRVVEFVAGEPGDWPIHCHMTHHTMTQMGHGMPNLLGAKTGALDERMRSLVPGTMTMGTTGMGSMSDMEMPVPPNSLPMRGTPGPFGSIDMGGMFTILKVRDDPAKDEGGWYRHPEGTVAGPADPSRMRADGVA